MSPSPSGKPTIRNSRPADLEGFYEIDRICFPADLAYSRAEMRFYVKHRFSLSLAAELAGRLIGFAIGRLEGGRLGHVITVDVLPESRRCGVGAALMTALHREFRERGVPRIILEVETGNEAAQKFYLSLGYRRGEILRNYYPGGRDACRMELSLIE